MIGPKKILLFCLTFISFLGAYDLRHPALNPVTVLPSGSHGPLHLVRDGKLQFAVVASLSDENFNPYPQLSSVSQASRVLKKYLSRAYGSEVAVYPAEKLDEAMAAHPYVIVLGKTALNRKYAVDPRTAGREGFIVKTFPRGILVSGNDFLNLQKRPQRATLWGTMDLLERIFSCRFYFPGRYGSVLPRLDNLTVKPFAYRDAPRFRNRTWEWWIWAMPKKGTADEKEFNRLLGEGYDLRDYLESQRLEITDSFWVGHNPNPQLFAKSTPDKIKFFFYTAPSGNFYHNPLQHIGNYWDVTNLKLADYFVNSLKRYYQSQGRDNEGWHMLSDEFCSFGQCDCDVPLADLTSHPVVQREGLLTERHIQSSSPYSDLYVRFWNRLARGVEKEFPGRKIGFLPYSNCTYPPLNRNLTLPGNAELRVCVYDFPTFIGNAQVEKKWLEVIKGWSRVLQGRPVGSLWFYTIQGNTFARAVAPMRIGRAVKLLGKYLGNEDIFYDQDHYRTFGDNILFYYYVHYVGQRQMWNPDFNGQAALDEHWKLFFGEKAGAYLKEFHGLLIRLHDEILVPHPDQKQPQYPLPELKRLEELLKLAEKALVPGSVEHKRYQIVAYPWALAISAQRMRAAYRRPVYHVRRLMPGQTVKLDGRMDREVYEGAASMLLIDAFGNQRKLNFSSDIRLAWGKDGIYGIVESPWDPAADAEKSLWDNTNIEILVSPGMDQKNYFHYAVDVLNRPYFGTRELLPVNKPYNSNWKSPGFRSAAYRGNNRWGLEFFIPYKDLMEAAPSVYQCWHVNVVVNKKSAPADWGSTSMTVGQNHLVENYGMMKFLGYGE